MQPSSRSRLGLRDSCQYLKGVGPKRAADLARLGIVTVEDLLSHFPRDYLDLGERVPMRRLRAGDRVIVRGRVLASGLRRHRRGLQILNIMLEDDSGRLNLVFFNQPYLQKLFRNGSEVIASGEVGPWREGFQMQTPEFEILDEEPSATPLLERKILPIYPLTRGLSQRWLRRLMDRVLENAHLLAELPEILPGDWLAADRWPARSEAVATVHFPPDAAALARARERLKFEELFLLQLLGALRRRRHRQEQGPRLGKTQRLLETFLAGLPFDLTGAQRRAIELIGKDLSSGGRMNRLLQGDVGSGKTVVALAALILAAEAGYQGAFMVPLEVLARQHYEGWRETLAGLGLEVALLTGSTPAKERRRVRAAIADGSAQLVFGTQALIQEGVEFARLGLAVVDEQHRFGVQQRASLHAQGAPHMLVMSATPIPRSLAMTLYGDLDLVLIDELPPGRPALVTRVTDAAKQDQVYSFLRERLAAGERAFLIFPLVEESDRLELKALTEEFQALRDEAFPDFPCDLIHGRLAAARKVEALERFRRGETQVLAATTVIEVGVDVPEATLMVIHNPERFGLSQLHQLRGRIGRGTGKSYCILMAPPGLGEDARQRLTVFARHRDGFRLAEQDLEQRGPGELFGLRQHGRPELSLAHPIHDAALVELARRRARELVDRDPELVAQDLRPLRDHLLRVYRDRLALAGVG